MLITVIDVLVVLRQQINIVEYEAIPNIFILRSLYKTDVHKQGSIEFDAIEWLGQVDTIVGVLVREKLMHVFEEEFEVNVPVTIGNDDG